MRQCRIQAALGLVLCAAVVAGCRHRSAASGGATCDTSPATKPAPATTQGTPPATGPATGAAGLGFFKKESLGVSLDYPAGWKPRPSEEYELLLIPAEGPGGRSISLDVPDLPPHIPGMIPIGLVKKGYLDDLRKKSPSLQTREESPTINGATARLVISTWKEGGKTNCERALILIHKDRVYILRSDSDAEHESATLAVFGEIVKSLVWTK